MALRTTILYQKGNAHGLSDDVVVIQRLLAALSSRGTLSTPILADLREPLSLSDIQIHLEIPVYGAIPWGHVNILLVNPEQWSYAYDAYVHAFDAIFFRDALTAELFRQDFMAKGIPSDHLYTLPWCDSWETDVRPMTGPQTPGFVCFLAGSTTKYEYVKQLLPHWKAEDPPLRVYTTRQDVAEGLKGLPGLASSVTVCHKDLTSAECKTLSREAEGHLIVSQAEGYGYAAAHAETMGAFAIMNRLPVWQADYESFGGVAWLSNETTPSTSARCDLARPGPRVREELEEAFDQFRMGHATSPLRKRRAEGRFHTLVEMSRSLFERLFDLARDRRVVKTHRPPLLYPKDCPAISIVTPTYHRQKLMDIAFHNMLATDYPRDKIEWVIVEDGTDPALSAREKIISFQLQVPELSIKYIPIEGKMTIGEKRNLGVEHSKNEIIVFMDDDDHYPSTSFRRRVAWLLCNDKKKIASCTTLALYDLIHGVSAVNVPPFQLPLSQRISEATLTFQKSAWRERPFPAVSLSEGEGWIEGREQEVLEFPPQQIIVAFTHRGNSSGRRIPPAGPPSCFWGFPQEFLVFIHELAGVEVEAVEETKDLKGAAQ
jgi:hypothetical protein